MIGLPSLHTLDGAQSLYDVVGVAVVLGEDESLGNFGAAGKDFGEKAFLEGADDGADLVGSDHVAIELDSPGVTPPGRKSNSREPIASPLTSALPTFAAARTDMRCCGCNPGLERRARMLRRWNGLPVSRDSARLVRRICPPPSPNVHRS